ncbi:MAG: hypothetical protein MAG794_01073 [Gammaproteobacteria bacterium]|nr:hypothetical protein [Gammaproteobacteria bacterium]
MLRFMSSLKSTQLSAICALAFAISAIPLVATAQNGEKYGFVNISQVITQSDEGQTEAKELESLGAEKEQRLNARRQKLEELAEQYEESVQSGQPDAELRDRIKKLKRELERNVRQAQSDIDVSRKDRIQQLGAKVVQVVQQFARDNDYTAIFRTDNGQVVYVDSGVNVTEEVIAAYNKAHPIE